MRRGGTVTEEHALAVIFQDDKLVRAEGDLATAFPATAAAPQTEGKIEAK
jgi:hypothetical protein